jgi:PAS domain S-box-containing protein
MRSVVNYVSDGIITFDQHGRITSFNSGAENIFGYAAPEVIRQNIKLLMRDSYHTQHDDLIANYLRTWQAEIIGVGREVIGRRKDNVAFQWTWQSTYSAWEKAGTSPASSETHRAQARREGTPGRQGADTL